MAGKLKRIPIGPETDLAELLEQVHEDREPRLLERNGRALAVIVSPESYLGALHIPTEQEITGGLAAAGAWADMDAGEFKQRLYELRHASPPSPQVSFE